MQSQFYKLPLLVLTIYQLSSCTNEHKNNLTILAALERSLTMTSLNIQSGNNTIYHALESKAVDRKTMHIAKMWQPKALDVKNNSDELVNYIEHFKKEIKEQAGLRFENWRDTFNYNDQNAVRIIYNKKGTELLKKLKRYKMHLLSADSIFNTQFKNTLPVDIREIDNPPAFIDNYFANTPAISALAVLSNFQARIRSTENIFATYCLERSSSYFICGFGQRFVCLVSQSSSYVKKKEEITITTGVGTFFSETDPSFIIAGKKVKANEEGYAVYNFKASSKPGKHIVPVVIEYYLPDGTKQAISKDVEYEVAEDE